MIDGLAYGTISWQAMLAVADLDDPDGEPDILPVGDGTVTITPSCPSWLVAGGTPPLTLFGQKIVLTIGNGSLMDGQGNTTIPLLADTAALNPTGWTYRADYSLNDNTFKGSVNFHLDAGEHVDLTTVIPVSSSNGVPVIQGPKGDPGENGIGIPESETDAYIAGKITTSGSAIDTALRGLYASQAYVTTAISTKQDTATLDSDIAGKIALVDSAIYTQLAALFEPLVDRTNAVEGSVPVMQANGLVAFTNISDLTDKVDRSELAAVAFSGSYADLAGRPGFAVVATSGQYSDLQGTPAIPTQYTDEQVRDVVGTTLVAGANITVTVNDDTDTITIASTGGTGSSTPADGSITEAKLAFDVATQAELDTAIAPVTAATDANTPSTLVKRDATGGFSAQKVSIVGTPVNPTDAATVQFVNDKVSAKFTVSTVAPSSPSLNDVWIDLGA